VRTLLRPPGSETALDFQPDLSRYRYGYIQVKLLAIAPHNYVFPGVIAVCKATGPHFFLISGIAGYNATSTVKVRNIANPKFMGDASG
jgi:hypothetical protein